MTTEILSSKQLFFRNHLSFIAEQLLTFYLASFCVGMYITHRGENWLTGAIIILSLYAIVIAIETTRIIKRFPMEAIMLITPIAPLIAMIMVVTLIPILQAF